MGRTWPKRNWAEMGPKQNRAITGPKRKPYFYKARLSPAVWTGLLKSSSRR